MDSKWQALKLPDLSPITETVDTASTTIKALAQTIEVFLTLQKLLIKLITAQATAALDPIKPALQAVQAILDGILKAGHVHLLVLPFPRTLPALPGQRLFRPANIAELSATLGLGLPPVVANANSYETLRASPVKGGNAAYIRTVVDSLYDNNDPCRPLFGPETAVTCVAVVAGGTTYAAMLKAAASLQNIFELSTSLAADLVPSPRNVKLRGVPVVGLSRAGVKISWDVPSGTFASPYFPGVEVTALRCAVIRSTARNAYNARTVQDLFGTGNLSEGLKDSRGLSEVLFIGDGSTAQFVDSLERVAGVPYHYAVVWDLNVIEKGVVSPIGWGPMSTIQRYKANAKTTPRQGVPPDWSVLPGPLDFIPGFANTVRMLSAFLSTFTDTLSSDPSDALIKGIDAVIKTVKNNVAKIEALTKEVDKLKALSIPANGLYMTQFAGIGGTPYIIDELSARLLDTSDPNRPPFDGNEPILGFVLVSGGARMVDIAPITALFELLFGSKGKSPILTAIENIGAVVEVEEVAAAAAVAPFLTDPVSALPPVISDAGEVVAAGTAANPSAGFTNVQNIEDVPC